MYIRGVGIFAFHYKCKSIVVACSWVVAGECMMREFVEWELIQFPLRHETVLL